MKTIKEAKESVGELISFSRGISWYLHNAHGFNVKSTLRSCVPPSQIYMLLSASRTQRLKPSCEFDASALMNENLQLTDKTSVMCKVLYAGKVCVIFSHIDSIKLSTQNS
jgi:hypothetical protein